MKEYLLKVVKVERIEDKFGHKGKKATMDCVALINGVEAIVSSTPTSRNFWGERDIPSLDGSGMIHFPASSGFHSLDVGKFFSGRIIRLNTTPYEINGRVVRSWTGIVLENEDAYQLCARSLSQYGAVPLNEDGEPMLRFLQTSAGVLPAKEPAVSEP